MKFVNNNDFPAEQYQLDASEAIAQRRQPQPPIFVDVRTTEEYKEQHLAGANLIPAEFLEDHLFQLPPFAHIILYGEAADEKTIQAVKLLRDNGFNEVSYVPGGLPALVAALKADDQEIFLADLPKEQWNQKIEEVLTQKVRPALASDGGGLEVLKIMEDKLYVQYQGACSGCSSSTAGTLRFIQGTLRVALNHDIEVITA